MSVKILIRRGTAAEWTAANPILASGEFGYETDTQKLKIGNGTSAWTSLAYTGATDVIPASAITAKGQIITGSDSTDYAVLSIGSAGQILIEDPVAGTLSYQGVALNDLLDVDTSGAVTNDLLARGASQWEDQSFSTVLTASEETVRSVLANGDMTKRRMIGVAGYFARGIGTTTVYKWAFPADTVSTTTAAPAGMDVNAGFANPAVAGYFNRGNNTTTVYKWAFTADTVSTTNYLPGVSQANAGFCNTAVAGYFSRGSDETFNPTTSIYKVALPSDTITTTTAAPNSLYFHAGFANPAVAGYFNRAQSTTTVYKWAFPSDTVSTTTATPATMFVNAGFANPAVAGYFSRKTSTNSFYKMTFPTDTVSTTASGTSSDFGVYGMSALANPAVAGYFTAAWGGISGGAATNIIYKMSFYDETISTTTSAPSTFSNSTGGFANG